MTFTGSFIGEAELSLLNENRVTEGRHILPLSGTSEVTYGSLTVEVTSSVSSLKIAAILTLYCMSLFFKNHIFSHNLK